MAHRLARVVLIACSVAVSLLPAAYTYAQDCDKVLENGVFDTTLITADKNLEVTFNQYIYQANFASHQQANDNGFSIGTLIYGIPLKLGGTFSSKEKEEWRSKHQEFRNERTTLADKYATLIRAANPDVIEAWTQCVQIRAASKVGLSAWCQYVNATSAVLHVFWIPMAGDKGEDPIVATSSILGGVRGDGIAVPLPEKFQLRQGSNGNIVALKRIPTAPLIVTVRTNRGDVSCTLPAPPKPTCTFSATPPNVTIGQPTTLVWNVSKGESVSIDNGLGSVSVTGSTSVHPDKTKEYVLTATNGAGSVTCRAPVEVIIPPPPSFDSVRVVLYTHGDDKDKEETIEMWVKSGDKILAHETHGQNERWEDGKAIQKAFVMKLDQAIPCTTPLNIRIYKHPHGSKTGCGWEMSMEATANCSNGDRIQVKGPTSIVMMGDGSQNDWDRTW
jgi:hypothetical protein